MTTAWGAERERAEKLYKDLQIKGRPPKNIMTKFLKLDRSHFPWLNKPPLKRLEKLLDHLLSDEMQEVNDEFVAVDAVVRKEARVSQRMQARLKANRPVNIAQKRAAGSASGVARRKKTLGQLKYLQNLLSNKADRPARTIIKQWVAATNVNASPVEQKRKVAAIERRLRRQARNKRT